MTGVKSCPAYHHPVSDALTTPVADAPDGVGEEPRRPAPRWVLVGAGLLLLAWYAVTVRAVGARGMHDDLGIQYWLARITAEGAVPLVDFEHGWNTASWYLSALAYRIADGNVTGWLMLWGRTGFWFAGIAMLVVARRVRMPTAWVGGLVATWLLLTGIPHNKYATATVWVAVLLPAWGRRLPVDRALRVGIAATVWWFHVELAVLLAVGTAMYDVFGRDDLPWRERMVTGLHAPAGLAVGLASQVLAYTAVGLAPGEFLSQAVADWTVTEFGPLFGYPLGNPETIRMALYPASVLVPFVPLLWRRLSRDTRLVAMCHLALALIAIRRPGDGHVGAAGSLLGLLVALVAFDLSGRAEGLRGRVMGLRWTPRTVAAGLGGVGWYAVGLAAGFRVASFGAIVALCLVVLATVAAGWRGEAVAASVGAMIAATTVVVTGSLLHVALEVRADEAFGETDAITVAAAGEVDRCIGEDRRAWVVRSPLTLYGTLDLQNPTRIYAFWYNLEAQAGELEASMRSGEIPAILQVTAWPESMAPLVEVVQEVYEVCAEVPVPDFGRTVRIWVHPSGS